MHKNHLEATEQRLQDVEGRVVDNQEQSVEKFNKMHENTATLLKDQVSQSTATATATVERLAQQAVEDVKKRQEDGMGEMKEQISEAIGSMHQNMPEYIMQTLRNIVYQRGALSIGDGEGGVLQLTLGDENSGRAWEVEDGEESINGLAWPVEQHEEAAALEETEWDSTQDTKATEEEEHAKIIEEEPAKEDAAAQPRSNSPDRGQHERPRRDGEEKAKRDASSRHRSDASHHERPRLRSRSCRRQPSRRRSHSHRRRSKGNRSRSRGYQPTSGASGDNRGRLSATTHFVPLPVLFFFEPATSHPSSS